MAATTMRACCYGIYIYTCPVSAIDKQKFTLLYFKIIVITYEKIEHQVSQTLPI